MEPDGESLRDEVVHALGVGAASVMDIFDDEEVVDASAEFARAAHRFARAAGARGMEPAQVASVLTGMVVMAALDNGA